MQLDDGTTDSGVGEPSRISDHQFSLAMFALGEAGRTLTHQQAELDRVRERSVAQLGIAFALSSVILDDILGESSRGLLVYGMLFLSTVAAVVAVFTSYRVWRTAREWSVKVKSTVIIQYAEPSPDLPSLSTLVGYYDKARLNNEPILEGKRREFRIATIANGLLLVFLVSTLWGLG